MTLFYDFLWEAVRRPRIIIEYANQIGINLPPPPEDFYMRLEYVAKAAKLILEIERDDSVFWRSRCIDAKRFYIEASQDLREMGIVLEDFNLC
ncbi:conserved hypothetical protein [Pyrobaculum islandicum DSM 4184]|uniref:Uncharacterized protein n=1 Tax=Pyrobaculum islandicum (strain DSM 4184 / JCM 9189 / GEO3) TaxID=384616 RepID=A1RV52_PYRIL|nr:hypothetical protein [Pyrobaculum islandicum]ABL88834.1 conserved hypothetical protein [Pyrobaculum islandicum DSM 4184]